MAPVAPAPTDPVTPAEGTAAPEPTAAEPPMPGPTGDQPVRRVGAKPAATVCMRACNKAQHCGTARGAVSACVSACLEALKGTTDDARRTAVGFRAQERCADRACGEFDTCVGHALLGEQALSDSPPVAPDSAQARCQQLCNKEKECDPERFAQRPGGMRSCMGTCVAVLVSPEEAQAVRRVLMTRSIGCIDKPCADFKACVQAAVSGN